MQYPWVIIWREICNSPTPRGALRAGWAQKSPHGGLGEWSFRARSDEG